MNNCKICGKPFKPQLRKSKKGFPRVQKYCSLECYLLSVKPPERTCEYCGNPIPQSGWSYEAKFCSRECYYDALEHSGAWKGGRSIDPDGYVRIWIPENSMAREDGYVLEHRLIMAKLIGRDLDDEEVVHHINGNKQDNRPQNLELFASQSEHMRHHKLIG